MNSLRSLSQSLAVVAVAVVAATTAPAAISLGTTDTFQSGTVNEWYGGTLIANTAGGPLGASDLYLNIRPNGNTSGNGSHLAAHNSEDRWFGDYTGAGVTGISVDMRNLGTASLSMRLVIFGLGTRYTSSTPLVLAPGSGWTHYTFAINSSSLTRVLGTSAYADVLGSVSQIMFRHDSGTPSSGGESVAGGVIGLDNVTAVPAPGAITAPAALALLALRRPRRTQTR